MSLDEHSALIEQLKPLLMEPDFHELFERLTTEESNSTRFLLKMELNRISSPCTRIIDLRDKSELPCAELIHGKQQHFLDDPAKESFLETVALYRNHYTLGVYEKVIEAHKLRKQKLRDGGHSQDELPFAPYLAQGVVLGSYFNRSEERMNYSIRISVLQPNRTEIQGITVDLSVGGARIRLPLKHNFELDKPIRVKLLELGEEYYYEDLQQGVDYEVVDTQVNNEYCWMRLKRVGGSDALSEMLSNLIRGYKFRYKVDINDVLVAATGLGFERHYLPHLPHLPLYLESIEGKYQITHKLLSRDNQQLQYYFQDEHDVSQLTGMLSDRRLKNLINEPENKDHQLFFCFTFHTQGHIYFYSATLAELKQKDLLALFFSFGASKPSWKVFKLAHHKIDHGKSYKASMLPGDETNYNALTESQLKCFTHVLQLMDLTTDESQQDYLSWGDRCTSKANELKVFGQQKVKSNPIKLLSLQFSERRNEARYSFKTQVKLSQGKLSITASTHDISSKGLQLTLDEATQFDKTAPIHLGFPKLQQISGKVQLSNLSYRLVKTRKKGGIVHLAAVMGHSPHVGVEFINKLIIHNRDKLEKITEANSEKKELADGLKNLLMRHLDSVPYFVEKTPKSAKLSILGVGTHKNVITDIFAASASQSLEYNLESLLKDGRLKTDFIEPIRALKPQDGLEHFEIYLQVSRQSQGQVRVKCIPPNEIGDLNARQHFIHQSNNLGRFMALRIYRGATGKPDLNYIRREMEYIGIHAHHKSKKLEELMWQIIGVGELLDITEEVLLRYPQLHETESIVKADAS
ncbi:PilZ domain-containing protein [Shewanella psychrophila]|uniref:PilZ domain-containing protein n=1 Tax=Shewanella psychrophila TaxID=225848 RepID=A0A1S6HV67_9GAMM|nr:PilZ domain-containing protein [Shewanella psychrophila]AQS39334.1 PilZ domain-containing protein [Shewanella psychrophila]